MRLGPAIFPSFVSSLSRELVRREPGTPHALLTKDMVRPSRPHHDRTRSTSESDSHRRGRIA